MADRSRDEKLAAAKKRLKKFQKNDKAKTKKPKNCEVVDSQISRSESPVPVQTNGKLSPTIPELLEYNFQTEENDKAPVIHEMFTPSDSAGGDMTSRALPQDENAEIPSTLNPSFAEMDSGGQPQNGRPTASTERIMQLSRHLNGIINDDMNIDRSQSETTEATIRDLETRNVELAALLEKRNHSNEQLSVQITQLREYNQRLQTQITDERASMESSLQRDLDKARDQVSAHLQTVGILVAEKSELQSQLSHSLRQAQQRLQEIEELTGRLRAARGRVDELEASITSGRESSAVVDSQRRELKREVERLQLELQEVQINRDEATQVRDELQQRLQARTQECAQLEKTKEEFKKQVELSQIYIEQLSSSRDSANEEAVTQVRNLEMEKSNLQTRVAELDAALNQLTDERDRLASQYREYIQQLQSQAQQLSQQLTKISEERDSLRAQVVGLEQIQTESQKREDKLRDELKSFQCQDRTETSMETNADQSMLDELRQQEKEKSVLEYTLNELRNRESVLSAQLEEVTISNRRLNGLLEERELERLSLSERLEQAKEERVDTSRLLEEMQSDKTALSRALTQNKDMKVQLMELETRFVNMTNENMEVTTQLQHEQHVSKELATRLQEQEEELNEVRKLLSAKEEELRGLKQSYYTVTQQMFDLEGNEERTRAMQAQTQLAEKLQKELTSAQETINSLTSQNSELRTLVYQAQDVMSQGKETVKKTVDTSQPPTPHSDDHRQEISALQASVAQLQMERDQLLTQCQIAEADAADIRLEMENLRPAVHEGRVVTAERFTEVQIAQEQLEEKFNRAMERQAELNDQNDYLEHLVMQLEGETATIGDYISIYQRQRQALLEREKMKSQDMRLIEMDRQRLRNKLSHLQTLVLRLLQEKEGSAQLTEYLTSLANGESDQAADDWPSITTSSDEDDDLENGILKEDLHSKSELSVHTAPLKKSSSATSSPHQIHKTLAPKDHTAQEIIHLISELGVNQEANGLMTFNHDINYFRPCKCCTGKLHVV